MTVRWNWKIRWWCLYYFLPRHKKLQCLYHAKIRPVSKSSLPGFTVSHFLRSLFSHPAESYYFDFLQLDAVSPPLGIAFLARGAGREIAIMGSLYAIPGESWVTEGPECPPRGGENGFPPECGGRSQPQACAGNVSLVPSAVGLCSWISRQQAGQRVRYSKFSACGDFEVHFISSQSSLPITSTVSSHQVAIQVHTSP